MTLLYKTLFEIKLLHEYYLTSEDGSTIFEMGTQPDRLGFLRNEFRNDRSAINNDLRFQFHPVSRDLYEGSSIKLLPAYSGCRVVTRVKAIRLADQSLAYETFLKPETTPDIFILILKNSNEFDAYTNARLRRSFNGVYFFSNTDVPGVRSFPFLTSTVPVQDPSLLYEQGELSTSGVNIQQFFREGSTDKFVNVNGSGFANEADRLLLSDNFTYHFSNTTGLTEANFILKDFNGIEVANHSVNKPAGINGRIPLNFSGKIKTIPLNGPFPVSEYFYSLEVTGNNGIAENHRILFSNELTAGNIWGVIHISTVSANPAFNYYANDGFLVTRKDPFNVRVPAPVFEIPIKSRLAYWRFINNKGNELNISPALTDFVNKENHVLVTKKPRPISRHWLLLSKEAPAATVYVPNPVTLEPRLEADRRLFFDIMVPQSELFPLVP